MICLKSKKIKIRIQNFFKEKLQPLLYFKFEDYFFS